MIIQLRVPEPAAEALIGAGLATGLPSARTEAETIAVAVTAVGVVANLVTIATSTGSLAELVRSICRWGRDRPAERSSAQEVTLDIQGGVERTVISVKFGGDSEPLDVDVAVDAIERVGTTVSRRAW